MSPMPAGKKTGGYTNDIRPGLKAVSSIHKNGTSETKATANTKMYRRTRPRRVLWRRCACCISSVCVRRMVIVVIASTPSRQLEGSAGCLAGQAQLDDRRHEHDQEKDIGHRARVAHLELTERLLPEVEVVDVGRRARTAAGHDEDLVEDLEGADH